jgi:amino acid transporter
MIAGTFAEVGSRFDATGGPYLYTKTAFGWFPRRSRLDAVVHARRELGVGHQRPRRALGFYRSAVRGAGALGS